MWILGLLQISPGKELIILHTRRVAWPSSGLLWSSWTHIHSVFGLKEFTSPKMRYPISSLFPPVFWFGIVLLGTSCLQKKHAPCKTRDKGIFIAAPRCLRQPENLLWGFVSCFCKSTPSIRFAFLVVNRHGTQSPTLQGFATMMSNLMSSWDTA